MKLRIVPAQSGDRPSHGSRAWALFALIVLAGTTLALPVISYPWAFPWLRLLTGAPTLVGAWYGEVTTATGRRQAFELKLKSDVMFRRCNNCLSIEAAARVCDARGERAYRGDGRTGDWRGTKFDVALLAADERLEGLRLVRLHGVNDGQVVRATLELEAGHGSAAIAIDAGGAIWRPGADPDTLTPVTLTLRRDGEQAFALACRRLLRRGRGPGGNRRNTRRIARAGAAPARITRRRGRFGGWPAHVHPQALNHGASAKTSFIE